jgi:AcrR family transcriptional regulator
VARPTLQPAAVEEFRERLCETAMRLFAERGFDAVTLRGLAAELGCSYATPYRYFRDKHEIYAAVRDLGFRRFAEFLEDRCRGLTVASARFRELCIGYVAFAREQPHAFRIMFQLEQSDDAAYAHLDANGSRAWQLFHGAAGDWVQSGEIAGDATLIAHEFWAALHGIVSLELAGKLVWGVGAAELVEPLMAALESAHKVDAAVVRPAPVAGTKGRRA